MLFFLRYVSYIEPVLADVKAPLVKALREMRRMHFEENSMIRLATNDAISLRFDPLGKKPKLGVC